MPPLPARLRRQLDALDACDAGAIVTTIRDTVSCSWIFYSECRPRARRRSQLATLRGKPRPSLAVDHTLC